MNVRIEDSWKEKLTGEFEQPYFKQLTDFVKQEYQTKTVYPPPQLMFRAFDSCPFEKVKVVILGQDPYHGVGQANGLCFSVNPGVALPPSLINIYKEIEADLGVKMSGSGDLGKWAEQGVLLLNATLTVLANRAGSHQRKGWEQFTDKVIELLAEKRENLVFMLWGSYAQEKGAVIDSEKHLTLRAPHPSPLSASRGFFGCKHFSKANAYLKFFEKGEIDWAI